MAQSREQASAAARRQARLEHLDSIGSQRSEFDSADMFNVLENDVATFIERVHTNVNNTPDFVNTGGILNMRVETDASGIKVIIPNHLLFQDKGVNGSVKKLYDTLFTYRNLRPPVSVMISLIKSKNIQLRNEENYGGEPSRYEELDNDKLIEQAAYGMREKIFKEGFKPRNVYSKEIPQLVTDLQQSVTNYLTSFITQTIVNNDTQTNIPL